MIFVFLNFLGNQAGGNEDTRCKITKTSIRFERKSVEELYSAGIREDRAALIGWGAIRGAKERLPSRLSAAIAIACDWKLGISQTLGLKTADRNFLFGVFLVENGSSDIRFHSFTLRLAKLCV